MFYTNSRSKYIKRVITKKQIEKLKNGSQAAFKEVYDSTYRLVKHITFSYVKDNELADDLVVDTYAKLWLNKERLDSINSNFIYYITQIAKNLSINFLKNNNFEDITNTDEYLFDVQANELYEQEVSKENNRAILAQISKIVDAESFEILILHYIHGYKFKEIAAIKNQKISTISVKASRAIKK